MVFSAVLISLLYDLAKLSHSIFGNYDLIVIEAADFYLSENAKMCLKFSERQSTCYFRKKFFYLLEELGVAFNTVRILEASLFFSMLPLHQDSETRMFLFLINALSILDELNDQKI